MEVQFRFLKRILFMAGIALKPLNAKVNVIYNENMTAQDNA